MRRRQDLPWRTTLKGVVVGRGPDDVMLLEGSVAAVWDLLADERAKGDVEALARATYPELTGAGLEAGIDLLAREGLLEP